MNKILNKIFRSRQSLGQFLFAGLGFLLGLLMLLLSVQLYIQVNKVLNPKNTYPEYLIVSKQVGLGNMLTMARASFRKKDLRSLKRQPFVEDIGEFKSNQYKVIAFAKGKIPFYSELFFESVPDQMIGEIPEGWGWKEGQKLIPVIISKNFLDLYNFGYALGNGFPQISKSTIGLLKVSIRIEGPQGKASFKGRVVGFSERIPSMIVPESFMDWANKNIGRNEEVNPSRLILKVKNPADPAIANYFEKKRIQINKDRLNASKAGGVIKIVMSVISILGAFFIALSFVIFMMSFRVVLAESKNEIKLLIQLGYTAQMIGKNLIYFFIAFVCGLSVLTFGLVYYGIQLTQRFMIDSGLEVTPGIEPITILVGLAFTGLTIGINILVVMRLLSKQA
ncbi:ABC transporter permease family protein [Microscilla marina]|uniref:Efflux ABC transporter, permease protein n=1 Tax=Microscilla marina ATCC 23134 TaxID=313606 RepID=A1ZGZ7_MICM2|nr:FtsX-like permease family protein [Microscilla marina]EAY30266.1 efflux ABC transporter, permease protein [Microscilla marina ATCC 23134]